MTLFNTRGALRYTLAIIALTTACSTLTVQASTTPAEKKSCT